MEADLASVPTSKTVASFVKGRIASIPTATATADPSGQVILYKKSDAPITSAFSYTTNAAATVSSDSIVFNSSGSTAAGFTLNDLPGSSILYHNYERWQIKMSIRMVS